MEKHFLNSSFREKLIEHLFVSELLKISWQAGHCAMEVAKPEVDNQGYDLIIEENGLMRHIQLKSSHRNAKARTQKAHLALARKLAGCIVWVFFDERTLELGPFLFFGDPAGGPLPSLEGFRIARHTKANSEGVKAERPEIREVPKSRFTPCDTVEQVYDMLFGR